MTTKMAETMIKAKAPNQFGFLYGFKLGRKEGESPGRLHFAMGYTF